MPSVCLIGWQLILNVVFSICLQTDLLPAFIGGLLFGFFYGLVPAVDPLARLVPVQYSCDSCCSLNPFMWFATGKTYEFNPGHEWVMCIEGTSSATHRPGASLYGKGVYPPGGAPTAAQLATCKRRAPGKVK